MAEIKEFKPEKYTFRYLSDSDWLMDIHLTSGNRIHMYLITYECIARFILTRTAWIIHENASRCTKLTEDQKKLLRSIGQFR